MFFDYTQIFVSPLAITFSEWVYTDLPKAQTEIKNLVVLVGASATTTAVGGTAERK